jgi:pyruvate dehydrogenase E2 component (dihydrolipoamide acetyltransferase)
MEFKLPDIGEGLEEGEVVKWLVKKGDVVKADQNIVTMETDKAIADLPSPVGGTILKIHFNEGDTVKVGQTLVTIGERGEKVKTSKKVEKPIVKKVVKEKDVTVEEKSHAETMKGVAATGKVIAAPAIRKLARDLKVDLAEIQGSGPDGRIVKKDLEQAKPKIKEATIPEMVPQQTITVKRKYDNYGYIEHIPLKGIRKTIAENMIKSQTEAAQVTAMEDIDVSKLWNLRKKEKRHFEIEGIKLTFLPFIIKACIAAMKENPILNSSLKNDEIIIKKYFNIGVAVETEVGLMVPVVKIAEKKSIAEIAKEIQILAEKARSRKIDIMDLQGSTFTITNYGSVGGNYATPILNPGEAAILGLGRIFNRVVINKMGYSKNVKILPISLTFDHRILDGAQAGRFLESLKIFLGDPDHLFGGMK